MHKYCLVKNLADNEKNSLVKSFIENAKLLNILIAINVFNRD